MNRKILAICAALMGLAAFAIIPAMAAASPVLTENGTAVEIGKKITATGEESSEFSSGFINVSCNDYWMTGKVHVNNGHHIEGTIESASYNWIENGTTEDCHSNLGATKVTIPGLTNEPGGTQHWCIIADELTPNEAEVVPHSCTGTGGEFTFVLNNTPGGTTCRYKRTAAIKATYTTGGTQATLKLKGEPAFELEQPSGFLCSATGKLTKMSFVLETDESPFTPLTIS